MGWGLGFGKQSLLKNDAQPQRCTTGDCSDGPDGFVFVLPAALSLCADAVMANACFHSPVSWLNKDYIHLTGITQ